MGAPGILLGVKAWPRLDTGGGYSPTGRSSGRVTNVMLDRNLGATLAVAVGTQSAGISEHPCEARTPSGPMGAHAVPTGQSSVQLTRPRLESSQTSPGQPARGLVIEARCLLLRDPLLAGGLCRGSPG